MRGRHGGGHQHGNAEVGAVWQAGDKAEDQQRLVARRQGAGEVAEGEAAHQQQKQDAPWQAGAEQGQHRCADHHAEGVGADHMADLRLADAKIGGDVGHQAHNGELAGADGEAAEGQGELNEKDRARRQTRRGVGCRVVHERPGRARRKRAIIISQRFAWVLAAALFRAWRWMAGVVQGLHVVDEGSQRRRYVTPAVVVQVRPVEVLPPVLHEGLQLAAGEVRRDVLLEGVENAVTGAGCSDQQILRRADQATLGGETQGASLLFELPLPELAAGEAVAE